MIATHGGAHAAAIARAIRASGVLVRIDPEGFQAILRRAVEPVVVTAPAGILMRKHGYLTSYKGLAFFTVSADPLPLPGGVEVVTADKIFVP